MAARGRLPSSAARGPGSILSGPGAWQPSPPRSCGASSSPLGRPGGAWGLRAWELRPRNWKTYSPGPLGRAGETAWSGSPHPPSPAPAWSDPFQTPVSNGTLRSGKGEDPRGRGMLRVGFSCAGTLPLLQSEVWGAETRASVALAVSLYRGGSQGRARCPLPVPAPRVFIMFSVWDVVKVPACS